MFKCRHILIVLVLCIVQIALVGTSGLAQDAVDYPEITVTASDEGITVDPPQVGAGITIVHLENTREETILEGLIGRLPEGVTPDDLRESAQTNPAGPLLLMNLYGGAAVYPGETATVTLDLKPGMHLIADRAAPQPGAFMVTESDSEPVDAPEPDVTLALVDFAFGIPPTLEAGEQIWHIHNEGQQFHEAALIRIPEGTTSEEAVEMIKLTKTYQGVLIEDSPVELLFLWPPMDPGEDAWVTLNLEPGTYAVGCLMPDIFHFPEELHLHIDEGMIRIFTVE